MSNTVNFEILGNDYGIVRKMSSLKKIKTREKSFLNIYDKYIKFLRNTIEDIQTEVVENNKSTEAVDVVSETAVVEDKKVISESLKLLLEKINPLVSDFIGGVGFYDYRALKMKPNMFAISYDNSKVIQSLDNVYESDLTDSIVENVVEESVTDNVIQNELEDDIVNTSLQSDVEVKNDFIDREISSEVNDVIEPVIPIDYVEESEMSDDVSNIVNNVFDNEVNEINIVPEKQELKDIKTAIDSSFDEIQSTMNVISPEEVRDAVSDVQIVVDDVSINDEQFESNDVISQELEDYNTNYDELKTELSQKYSRISKNNLASANLNKFDKEGSLKSKEDTEQVVNNDVNEEIDVFSIKDKENDDISNEIDREENVSNSPFSSILNNIPTPNFDDVINTNEVEKKIEVEDKPLRDEPVVVFERNNSIEKKVDIDSKEEEIKEESQEYENMTGKDFNRLISEAKTFEEVRNILTILETKKSDMIKKSKQAKKEKEELIEQNKNTDIKLEEMEKNFESKIELYREYCFAMQKEYEESEAEVLQDESEIERLTNELEEKQRRIEDRESCISEFDNVLAESDEKSASRGRR